MKQPRSYITDPEAPPASQKQLQGVQVLRFIAALLVVVHHAMEESMPMLGNSAPATPWVLFGASGVDVFFVISGFIMLHTTWPHFGRASAPRQFLQRRILRIFPLYWLCLGIMLAAWGSGLFYRSLRVDGPSLVGSIFLLPMGHPLMGVAWTLVFEMVFYAVFAVWIRRRSPLQAMLGTIASMGVLWVLANAFASGMLLRYLGSAMLFEFCMGLGVAALWRCVSLSVSGALPPVLMAVGTAGLVAASVLAPAHGTAGLEEGIRPWAWGLPAAMILYASLHWRPSRGRFLQWGVHGGDASYALYLVHPFVMVAYATLIKSGVAAQYVNAWLGLAAATALSIVLGCLIHQRVEKPLLRCLQHQREIVKAGPQAG